MQCTYYRLLPLHIGRWPDYRLLPLYIGRWPAAYTLYLFVHAITRDYIYGLTNHAYPTVFGFYDASHWALSILPKESLEHCYIPCRHKYYLVLSRSMSCSILSFGIYIAYSITLCMNSSVNIHQTIADIIIRPTVYRLTTTTGVGYYWPSFWKQISISNPLGRVENSFIQIPLRKIIRKCGHAIFFIFRCLQKFGVKIKV